MAINLLVISDIHGNFPALSAVEHELRSHYFDFIINCGDSTVYTPFANETLSWLKQHKTISILGNTDKKVIKLLDGKTFKKPSKYDKRIMYLSTAKSLTRQSTSYLRSLPKSHILRLTLAGKKCARNRFKVGIYHGSPAHNHEFLFNDTPDTRFMELAEQTECQLVLTGHSHTPYHKYISNIHFVNPGSVGRMFDGNPQASCAIVEIDNKKLTVSHFRISYDIEMAEKRIRNEKLPEIYCSMLHQGKKLN